MTKDNQEKFVEETIQYANHEIKRIKKNIYLKTFGLIFIFGIVLLFINMRIPVKYKENMVEVSQSVDQALNINVHLPNYKGMEGILVKTNDASYDLYIGINKTLITSLIKDKDDSDHLLRVGNGMIVDFKSESLRGFMPDDLDYKAIKQVYYLNDLSKKIKSLSNQELLDINEKILIWKQN